MRTLYVQGWFLLPDGFDGTKADALRLLAQYEEETPDPPLTACEQESAQELGSLMSNAARALKAFDEGKRMCIKMSVGPVDQWRSETEVRIAGYVNVLSCARCGRDHKSVPFESITDATAWFKYWATCPTNGQPILVREVDNGRTESSQ